MAETIQITDEEIKTTLDALLPVFPLILGSIEYAINVIAMSLCVQHQLPYGIRTIQDDVFQNYHIDTLDMNNPQVRQIFNQVDCFIRKTYSNQ